MPLNSAEIAGSIGQYQSMYTGQANHSGMIGGMMGMQGTASQQGDQAAGGAMSRMKAIGMPAAGLAAGMIGLDPIGMGMKAYGMASGAGMGMAGAGAVGLGAAGVAAGGAMAVGYAANQLFTGAQQQQQFNGMMRQSFHFQSASGTGFNNSQLGAMSSGIRQMAGQQGPSGEMSSFGELSTLASNLGRMGMATGVRDVQEFSKKFKEMVTVVKTVAKELGTSLETAQQMASGMRSSGLFKGTDQMRMAAEMRQLSVAGNVSISELSAAANIGSQISRAVGGRGRHGAFAGVRTLGAIGASVESGALSEEDIYNATGQTGAEGRQALAGRQLEQSASFLKSGRGRRFLASVAGEHGNLDAASVGAWQGGDMDIGSTGQATGRNLSKVGRASFLRNEGKLRGAALAAFGGNIGAMALSQWAGGKGIDLDSMDDRSMVFAGRQLGMGQDELEVALKQAKGAAMTSLTSRHSNETDKANRREAGRKATQGMAGLKKKFELEREHLQNMIQQVGADMFTDLSNSVESMINEAAGHVHEEASKDIGSAFQSAKMGDSSQMRKVFGIGQEMRPEAERMLNMAGNAGLGGQGGEGGGGVLGNFTRGGGLADSIKSGAQTGGTLGAIFGAGIGAIPGALVGGAIGGINSLLHGGGGTSDFERMQKAGYGSAFGAGGPKSDNDVTTGMARIHEIQMGALGPGSADGEKYGEKLKSQLMEAYGKGGTSATAGLDRINAHEKHLEQLAATSNPDAKEALEHFRSLKTDGEKAAYVNSAEGKMGLPPGTNLASNMSADTTIGASKGYATAGDRAKAIGTMALGREGSARDTFFGSVGKGIASGAGIGAAAGLGFLSIPGAIVGAVAGGIMGARTAGQANEAGQYMLNDRNQELSRDIMGGTAAEQESAKKKLNYDLVNLQKNPEANASKIEIIKKMQGVAGMLDFKAKNPDASPEQMAAHAKSLGHDPDHLMSMAGSMAKAGMGQQEINARAQGRAVGESSREELQGLKASGIFIGEKDGASVLSLGEGDKGKYGSKTKEIVAAKLMELAEGAKGGSGDTAKEMGVLSNTAVSAKATNDKIWAASTAERRQIAKDARDMGMNTLGQQVSEINAFEKRAERAISREGGAGIAKLFGVDASKEDKRRMRGMSGAELGKEISAQLGLGTVASGKGEVASAEEKLKAIQGRSDYGSSNKSKAEEAAAMKAIDEAKGKLDTAGKVQDIATRLKSKDPMERKEAEKAMMAFQSSPEGQKVAKDQQLKKDERNDPGVRAANANADKVVAALGDVAGRIEVAIKDGKT